MMLVILGWPGPRAVHSQNTWVAVETVDWSPDGSYVAFGYSDGSVRVLDAATDGLFADFQLPTQNLSVFSVAWSPDSAVLAIGAYSSQIYLWDRPTGQLREFSDDDITLVNCVAWSPDGTHLVSGNYNEKATGSEPRFTVKVWDVATGEALYTRPSSSDGGTDLAWSPDGSRLALPEESLRVVNTTTWSTELTVSSSDYVPGTVDWSPDSTRLVVVVRGEEYAVIVWNMAGDELMKFPFYADDARWSPDGTRIAILGLEDIQIVDSQTGQNLLTLPLPPSQFASQLAWSPDGNRLAYGDHSGNVYLVDATPAPLPR